jgi:hypothetical protein
MNGIIAFVYCHEITSTVPVPFTAPAFKSDDEILPVQELSHMWGAEPEGGVNPFECSGLFSSGELIIKTFPGLCPRHRSILSVISGKSVII